MINNIAYYAFARVVSGLFLYIIFIMALYGLDKGQYQYFSVSYPLYQILGVTCFGWIAAMIPSLFAGAAPDEQHQAEARLGRAFMWMCYLAIAILVGMRVLGGIDVPWYVLISIVAMTIAGGASDGILALANACERHHTYLLISAVRYGSALILMALVFALPSVGATGALAAIAMGAAMSVALWVRRREQHIGVWPTVTLREVAGLLKIGLPAIIAFAVYQLSMSTSRLIIANSCSLGTAAILGGVNDFLAGPILLVFQVINLAMNPRLYGAANRGDQNGLRSAAATIIVIQLAIILPSAIMLFVVGGKVGGLLLGQRLGPLVPEILPYIGLATLLSVVLNTAIGVALARKKATLMALFGLGMTIAAAMVALYRACDIVSFAHDFCILMALAALTGLGLIYGMTKKVPEMA